MWRGILSIVALLIIIGSLIVIVPIMILPNTFLHQLVPVLKPLHQAIACNPGETMEYETVYIAGSNEVRFRCVDAAGRVRDVDDALLTPAYYALGMLCLGILLMFAPFYVAIRQMRSNPNPELQAALQQSVDQFRQMRSALTQNDPSVLNASGEQQLAALNQLREQGHLTAEAHEYSKKSIFENFRA